MQLTKQTTSLLQLLTTSVIVCALHSPTNAAIIQLRKTAQCCSQVVTLGDIADVRDADATVAANLSKIELAPTPAAGSQLRLDFDAIRSRLRAHGVDLGRTEFGGSNLVIVTSGVAANAGVNTSGQDVPNWKQKRAERLLSDAIRQYLRGAAQELGATSVSFELKANEVEEVLLGAATGYQVTGGAAPWTGSQEFRARFLDRREQIHNVAIRANISSQPQVLAAKYNIPRGQVLKADDLVWRQATGSAETFSQVEQVLNHETTRMLRANEPIVHDDVRSTPLIRANDIVTVYANSPGMNIKRRMKARADGAMDEMVTLVSFDGKQTLSARVIGFHEAEVAAAPATNQTTTQIVANQPMLKPIASPVAPVSQMTNADTAHQPQRPATAVQRGRR